MQKWKHYFDKRLNYNWQLFSLNTGWLYVDVCRTVHLKQICTDFIWTTVAGDGRHYIYDHSAEMFTNWEAASNQSSYFFDFSLTEKTQFPGSCFPR